MYSKILVPLDGSRFGEHALPLAAGMAIRFDAALELVTVSETSRSAGESGGKEREATDDRLNEARHRAQAYLEEVAGRLRDEVPELSVETTAIFPGNVAAAVVQRARSGGADLIVMSTHGHGPLRRAWLGSVADSVVRNATCPVLLQRPPEEREPRISGEPVHFGHLLVPLDGSAAAEKILRLLPALAEGGSRLTLLRVIPPMRPVGSPYVPHLIEDRREHEEERSRAAGYLERKAEDLRSRGLDVEVRVEEAYQPAAAILDAVEDDGVDLVALTTSGRGGVLRPLMGSVADKVIRAAPCPVLVGRAPDAE